MLMETSHSKISLYLLRGRLARRTRTLRDTKKKDGGRKLLVVVGSERDQAGPSPTIRASRAAMSREGKGRRNK